MNNISENIFLVVVTIGFMLVTFTEGILSLLGNEREDYTQSLNFIGITNINQIILTEKIVGAIFILFAAFFILGVAYVAISNATKYKK